MKSTDLKPPFDWDDRKVMIHDRIWFVPMIHAPHHEFTFPGWNHPDLFGNQNPIHVEYCSGNGGWIIDQAIKNPEINWVAVEIKFYRVSKIWAKIKNLNLPNLVVVCGEGLNATRKYFPSNTIAKSFINFPDPWPKKKHAKNRLVQLDFTGEVARILNEDGTFTLVTDDPNYSEQMIEMLRQSAAFRSEYASPYYRTDVENYGSSFFEEFWRSRGKVIRFHHFRKHSA